MRQIDSERAGLLAVVVCAGGRLVPASSDAITFVNVSLPGEW
jgi:hypothetical protein